MLASCFLGFFCSSEEKVVERKIGKAKANVFKEETLPGEVGEGREKRR